MEMAREKPSSSRRTCSLTSSLVLFICLLAVTLTLQGIAAEGPSESECRPLIEKALKEQLGVGSDTISTDSNENVDGRDESTEVTSDSGDRDVESAETQEDGDATESGTNKNDSFEEQAQADAPSTQDDSDDETKENEDSKEEQIPEESEIETEQDNQTSDERKASDEDGASIESQKETESEDATSAEADSIVGATSTEDGTEESVISAEDVQSTEAADATKSEEETDTTQEDLDKSTETNEDSSKDTEDVSKEDGEVAASTDDDTKEHDTASTEDGVPSAEGVESAEKDSTSAEEGTEAEEGAASAEEGAASAEEGAASAEEGAASAEEGATSAEKQSESAEDAAASTEEGAASVEESAASVEEGAASTEEGAASVEESAASVEEGAASAEESATSVEEGPVSAEEGTTSVEEGAISAEDAASVEGVPPSEDTASVEDGTEPAALAEGAESAEDAESIEGAESPEEGTESIEGAASKEDAASIEEAPSTKGDEVSAEKETTEDESKEEQKDAETVEEESKETENVTSMETGTDSAEGAASIEELAEKSVEDTTEEEKDETAEETETEEVDETPEAELTQETLIPENLRPRDHLSELLHLDEESAETEVALAKAADVTLRELKRIYDTAIKPLEILYKYRDLSNRHFGDPEIFSKPLILFMGPWSGGKSSIINYLLDNEYNDTSLRTGAEPSPAYFNILMWGAEPEILDGTQLAADWTFSGLQKFGQGLEDRLRGLKLPNKLLEKVNIVEIPGILEVRKVVSRMFPFNDACQWFIDRADIIFLVYDPSKLDVGPETEAILDQLKGREYQTRIILNKADTVKPEELMRVQSALIWNISPLMSSPQPPVMYTTSLWSTPFTSGAPIRLLQAQERAFLRDLRQAVDKRVENKISSARRFAVRVRNHAKMVDCYLTTYYNHKSLFGNRKQIADEIIENPQQFHIYEGLSTLTNISRYDLPDPDVYKDFFKLNALYDFQPLSATCTYFRGCPINRLDVAIAYDLPELVGKHKKLAESATGKPISNS